MFERHTWAHTTINKQCDIGELQTFLDIVFD